MIALISMEFEYRTSPTHTASLEASFLTPKKSPDSGEVARIALRHSTDAGKDPHLLAGRVSGFWQLKEP